MRAFLFLILVLWVTIPTGSSADVPREEALIRRAFLDLTGLVPTAEEIDWYCVYNTDGYQLAINDLAPRSVKMWGVSPEECKAILASPEYKVQIPRPVDITPSIVYLAGNFCGFDKITPEIIKISKQMLIEYALKETSSPGDAIDYLCNLLMSRVSNVAEANMLQKNFNKNESSLGEHAAYMSVLEDILQLPDVAHK